MMIRRFSALTIAFMMLLSLAACGESNGSQSTSGSIAVDVSDIVEGEETVQPFSLGYYREEGLHPYTCGNAANQNIIGLVYEPLFAIDPTFSVEPCLALRCSTQVKMASASEKEEAEKDKEENTSENSGEQNKKNQEEEPPRTKITGKTTCTIQLRENITFSDGSALTAEDVVYSLEQAKKKGSIYRERLADVTAVKTSGSHTIVIEINTADSAFDALLDIPVISSAGGEYPLGTGPYILVTKKGNAVQLIQNDNWWQKADLPAETVKLYQAEDSDMMIFGFGSGNISSVSTDLTGTGALTYTGEYNVVDYPSTSMIYIGCNTRSGPCQDQTFRQALYYAFDRDTLAVKMLSGHAQPAVLPVSPASKYYDESLAEKYAWSEETAQEKLTNGHYYNQTLKLIVNSESVFKTAFAAELKKELENIGIRVEVEALEWSEFAEALEKRNFDLYLGEVKLKANFDLTALLGENGNLNYSAYKNEELEQLLTAYQTASTEKRAAAAKKLYNVIADAAVVIPLCFKNYSLLTHWESNATLKPTQQNLFYHISEWEWKGTSLS